jgi:hypothetical protein
MSRTCAAILGLVLSASAAAAQEPLVVVRGRVVGAENDRPLRRALVSVAASEREGGARVLTDQDGRFEIRVPEAGALQVVKAGYAAMVHDLPDRAASAAGEIDLRLPRGAALSGTVRDRTGAPIVGSRVVARRTDRQESSRAATFEVETDDRGEYRIGGLQSGQYAIYASPPPVQLQTPYRETAPGPVLRSARAAQPELGAPLRSVVVRSGEELGDVDVEVEPLRLPRSPVLPAALGRVNLPYATTAIRGRVILPTGEPVGGALVTISGMSALRLVIAEADGSFEIEGLPEGRYRLETGKPGYVAPHATTVADIHDSRMVEATGDVPAMDVVLSRGGVITGTVVDAAGEPLQGVLVRAMHLHRQGGRPMAIRSGWQRMTDDRGQFRLFGLPTGSFLLVMTLDAIELGSGAGRDLSLVPIYYPGTNRPAAAQALEVEAGREFENIHLTFTAFSGSRVSGKAVDASAEPLVGRVVLLLSARSGSIAPELRSAPVAPDGSFEFPNVPPGDYVVHALGARGPGRSAEFGVEYVSVGDSDPPGLSLKTSPGVTLGGRISVEGLARFSTTGLTLRAEPVDADRSPPPAVGTSDLAVYSDGRFYLTGVHGVVRLTLTGAPPGWYLKSIAIGTVDATDMPFDAGAADHINVDVEIVLSMLGAKISGALANPPADRLFVGSALAFSTRREDWFPGSRHVKRVALGPNGTFEIDGLPPGTYWVAAVDDRESADWHTPEFLDVVTSGATRVTVTPGQNTSLRLTRR